MLRGNLFDSAIMKTSVISDDFRKRYLSNPTPDLNAFEGSAVVFDGPEEYHARIDDPALEIDENTLLFIRGVGPIGYPGSAEVVNMQPPAALIKRGDRVLALHWRRPPVRHVRFALDPECLAGGRGWRRSCAAADRRPCTHRSAQGHRGHAGTKRLNWTDGAWRWTRPAVFAVPKSQTPWQEIYRSLTDQMAEGQVLRGADRYQRVAQTEYPAGQSLND